MSKTQPTYDLTLLLDSSATDDQRKKVLKDTEATIAKGGEVIGKHDWGTRATTYEINKKTDAEYHLIQFHGTPDLLSDLNRTLRITDGVLRFRVIKLANGVGDPPDLKSAPAVVPAAEYEAPAEEEPRSYEAPAAAEEPVAAATEQADEAPEPAPDAA